MRIPDISPSSLSFPGFKEHSDVICAGGETSINFTSLDGDSEKEYILVFENREAGTGDLRFNDDAGNNYLYTRTRNSLGTITTGSFASTPYYLSGAAGFSVFFIYTPASVAKKIVEWARGTSSGTSVSVAAWQTGGWTSTANVTKISLVPASSFPAHTRATLYKRSYL
jgi:hypothetical protein